jgi:hypothetical protein
LSVSHVVYGLRIETNIPLPGCHLQSHPDETDLRILLKQEKSACPSPLLVPPSEFSYVSPHQDVQGQEVLRVGLLAGGQYFGFFYSDGARFAVEREGREILAHWPEGYTLEDACTYLVGPVIAFVLRLRGVTCLHASAIAVGDRAIALMGAPGAGKSTTAAAFAHRGFPVLSDDVVALSDRGDHFLVQPGYPRVNLWPDSVRTLCGSEDALPHITPTWGKRYLPLGENGHSFGSKPLRLGAIYILSEREVDPSGQAVEEFSGSEAFVNLVCNTYLNYLLDARMRKMDFEVLGRVAAAVPVRRVRPAKDPARVFDLCERIADDARQLAQLAGHDSLSARLGSD